MANRVRALRKPPKVSFCPGLDSASIKYYATWRERMFMARVVRTRLVLSHGSCG